MKLFYKIISDMLQNWILKNQLKILHIFNLLFSTNYNALPSTWRQVEAQKSNTKDLNSS